MGLLNVDAYEGTAEILGETRHIRASSHDGLHIQGLSLADCNRIVKILQTGKLQAIDLGHETREAQSMLYDAVSGGAPASNGAASTDVAPVPAPAKTEEAPEAAAAEPDEEKPKRGRGKKKTSKRGRKAKAAPPPPPEEEEDDDEEEEPDDEDDDEEEEDTEELGLSAEVTEILPDLQEFKRVRPIVGLIVDKLDISDLQELIELCESIKEHVPALAACPDIPKRVKMAAATVGLN